MATKKTARNEPCPCGSGNKYKKCCQSKLPQPAETPVLADISITCLLKTGLAHQQAGQLPQAEAVFRQVLQTNPQHPDALHLLGLVALQTGQYDIATRLISDAIRFNPSSPFFYNNLGTVLKEQSKQGRALENYRKALALKPDYAQAYNNIAVILKEQEHFDAAIEHFKKAISIEPDYIEAHSNLGSCYKDIGNFSLAAKCHGQAILLNPNYAPAYNNLGRVFEAAGALDKAVDCYRKALSINPDDLDLQHNLSIVLLNMGEFTEGWRRYESRYHPAKKNRNSPPPKLPFQQWQGEPLAGKSLLIWPEQGFGDEIQFIRYVPMLKDKGAGFITVVCKKPLKPLFENLAGIDQLYAFSELKTIQYHDYWTFPLSIPLHCQTTLETIPAYPKYLSASSERIRQWQPKLPEAKFRVGMVWKGSNLHKNDANRSINHLRELATVWSVADIAFISLQKGQGEDETHGLPLTPLGPGIQDFADTAAIVSQLDLIICVDTVIAHLAGALGKPVWLLLPFAADWRWLADRTDSPWYPQTLLFRQKKPGDWEEVFGRVRKQLQAMAKLGARPS